MFLLVYYSTRLYEKPARVAGFDMPYHPLLPSAYHIRDLFLPSALSQLTAITLRVPRPLRSSFFPGISSYHHPSSPSTSLKKKKNPSSQAAKTA